MRHVREFIDSYGNRWRFEFEERDPHLRVSVNTYRAPKLDFVIYIDTLDVHRIVRDILKGCAYEHTIQITYSLQEELMSNIKIILNMASNYNSHRGYDYRDMHGVPLAIPSITTQTQVSVGIPTPSYLESKKETINKKLLLIK